MNTQERNFRFLLEYISSRLIEFLMRDQAIGLEEALLTLHNSETFEKLSDINTGLYIESPEFNYLLLNEEFSRGTLRGLSE